MLNKKERERACLTCVYWQSDKAKKKGTCRRYAPRPGDEAIWPSTLYNDWCGEYDDGLADMKFRKEIDKEFIPSLTTPVADTVELDEQQLLNWGERTEDDVLSLINNS